MLLVFGTIGIFISTTETDTVSGGLWDAMGYHFLINSNVVPTCNWVTCTKPIITV